jgi:hypothetical protein
MIFTSVRSIKRINFYTIEPRLRFFNRYLRKLDCSRHISLQETTLTKQKGWYRAHTRQAGWVMQGANKAGEPV